MSSFIVFLSPLFLFAAAFSRGLTPPFFEHDLQSVGLGISLILVYWGLVFLVLGIHSINIKCLGSHSSVGQTFAPQWFVFHRIFYTAGQHIRRHRSHISFMRQDRMRRLLNEHLFTVFVLGTDRISIPIGMSLGFFLWNIVLITKLSGHTFVNG